MPLTKIFFAGALAGVLGVLTSWLVTGVAFHPYQRLTPATWRATEGPRQYALASGATLLAALMIVSASASEGYTASRGRDGCCRLWFGFCCWAALGAPVCFRRALVNLHVARGGSVLDWLLVASSRAWRRRGRWAGSLRHRRAHEWRPLGWR